MTAETVTTNTPDDVQAQGKPPLDEIMLAMDVVDTLRRRQRLVEREYDSDSREQDLKQRLHKIYAAQGIEVPDHVLEEGVAALREERFVYKSPPKSFSTRLAHYYVTRGRFAARRARLLLHGCITTWTTARKTRVSVPVRSGGVDKRRARATGATTV
jgi:hypothetical protein